MAGAGESVQSGGFGFESWSQNYLRGEGEGGLLKMGVAGSRPQRLLYRIGAGEGREGAFSSSVA